MRCMKKNKLFILVVFGIFVFALLNFKSCGKMVGWIYGKYCTYMDEQYILPPEGDYYCNELQMILHIDGNNIWLSFDDGKEFELVASKYPYMFRGKSMEIVAEYKLNRAKTNMTIVFKGDQLPEYIRKHAESGVEYVFCLK